MAHITNPPFSILADLATCLCAQIQEDGGPEPCFCGVIPGDAAVQQYAGNCATKCGMAWVRLVTMYPASGVGIQSELVGNCTVGLGLQVEIGIMRCAPLGDDRGNPPTASQMLEATDQQIRDALTMRRALVCCPTIDSRDYILGSYSPAGPLGGLLGGTWAIALAL